MTTSVAARPWRARWFRIALVAALLLGAAGVWVLLHPASVFVQPWRAQRSQLQAVVFGPYPVEQDFVELQRNGVRTVISLLDPALPYEKVLLAQERERAANHGMQVLNFPMASILGQSFGSDYIANSHAAAEAALRNRNRGKVYIHCYLGLHRARYVRQFLAERLADPGKLKTRAGHIDPGRGPDTLALDHANFAYLGQDYRGALGDLATIRIPTDDSEALAGWSHYQLGEIEAARDAFARAVALDASDVGAHAGLGFAQLRMGTVDAAEAQFNAALALDANAADALEGLAYVRIRQGRRDQAVQLLGRVLALAPDNADARAQLQQLEPQPVATSH